MHIQQICFNCMDRSVHSLTFQFVSRVVYSLFCALWVTRSKREYWLRITSIIQLYAIFAMRPIAIFIFIIIIIPKVIHNAYSRSSWCPGQLGTTRFSFVCRLHWIMLLGRPAINSPPMECSWRRMDIVVSIRSFSVAWWIDWRELQMCIVSIETRCRNRRCSR